MPPKSDTKSHPSQRQKTPYAGVYFRTVKNANGKRDTAFDVTYKTPDGKKVWQLIGRASDGVTAAYANERRVSLMNECRQAEQTAPEEFKESANALTLGKAWEIYSEKWLPNLVSREKVTTLYNLYLQKLAKRRLDSIRLIELEGLKLDLLKQGLAPHTVKYILGILRAIYRKMSLWGLYNGVIPTNGLGMPGGDNSRARFLSRDEARQLLEELKMRSQLWYSVAWISLHTGMRKSEVLNLRKEHIDFAGGLILVKDAKTGSRIVPMTDEVEAFMRKIVPSGFSELLFKNKKGEVVKESDDSAFVSAVKACGFNDEVTDRRYRVVFHTLRHTFCSWLAMAGVPLHTIAELAGHKTIKMTQRYSHLCPSTGMAAAERISAIFGG